MLVQGIVKNSNFDKVSTMQMSFAPPLPYIASG